MKVCTTLRPCSRSHYALALTFALLQVLSTATETAAQLVDPGFAASIPLNSEGSITALALQPDGKILVGVSGPKEGMPAPASRFLLRLLPNGTLDNTFNATFDSSSPEVAIYSIVVQPDGKILAGGYFTAVNGANVDGRSYIVRLHPNGSTDGGLTPPLAASAPAAASNIVADIALQPDGKILIAGGRLPPHELSRLNSSGALDDQFVAPELGGSGGGLVEEVALQPDGKILAAGSFNLVNGAANEGLTRLMPNGAPDTTFVPVPFATGCSDDQPVRSRFVQSIQVRPDGRILAANNVCVLQLLPSGAFDPSFSPIPLGAETPTDLQLVPDGHLLLDVSYDVAPNQPAYYLFRTSVTGLPDPTFIPYPSVVAHANVQALAVQPDGNVLAAGYRLPLVRLLSTRAQTPGPPSLTVSNPSMNPISLSWSPGLGGAPQQYSLHAGSSPGASDFGVFSMGLGTSIAAPAPPSVPIFVRVVASNQFGSAASNEVRVLIGGSVDPPGAPTLTAHAASNPITLSWAAGAGGPPQSYTLLAGTSTGAADLGTFGVGSASSVSANAPIGVPLFVRVAAHNAAGIAVSNEVSFALSAPSPPVGPVVQSPIVDGSTVLLAWSGPAGASYTLLARSTPNGPILLSAPVGSITSLTVPGVGSGTYYVSAVAHVGGYSSAESNLVAVIVP